MFGPVEPAAVHASHGFLADAARAEAARRAPAIDDGTHLLRMASGDSRILQRISRRCRSACTAGRAAATLLLVPWPSPVKACRGWAKRDNRCRLAAGGRVALSEAR